MEWPKEQRREWIELVGWSHSSMIYDAARKLLSNAGIPIESLTPLQVFNIQDDIAYAIRRGAIRILNQINKQNDSGEF